mmetsp:Transcript_123445/g.343869  ORF Transcript_123445/g.343869 Transcript_123445/m.343869 type:complete len:231 (-) Transcript_123445:437-1129(-)
MLLAWPLSSWIGALHAAHYAKLREQREQPVVRPQGRYAFCVDHLQHRVLEEQCEVIVDLLQPLLHLAAQPIQLPPAAPRDKVCPVGSRVPCQPRCPSEQVQVAHAHTVRDLTEHPTLLPYQVVGNAVRVCAVRPPLLCSGACARNGALRLRPGARLRSHTAGRRGCLLEEQVAPILAGQSVHLGHFPEGFHPLLQFRTAVVPRQRVHEDFAVGDRSWHLRAAGHRHLVEV